MIISRIPQEKSPFFLKPQKEGFFSCGPQIPFSREVFEAFVAVFLTKIVVFVAFPLKISRLQRSECFQDTKPLKVSIEKHCGIGPFPDRLRLLEVMGMVLNHLDYIFLTMGLLIKILKSMTFQLYIE